MSKYFPVPVIHPRLDTRVRMEWGQPELREGALPAHPNNGELGQPAANVAGLERYPSHPIPLEDLDSSTIERLAPEPVTVRSQDPPRCPPPPVFGRSPDILDILGPGPQHSSAAASEHVIIEDSPDSPDPSPPSSPVNTPTKKRAPSPPMSPSKVKGEGPRYVMLQDHQFECPECPLPASPTLNGHFDIGMHGEVWPRRQLPASLATPQSGRRRPAPSPLQSRRRRPAPSPPTRGPFHLRDQLFKQFLGPLVLGICLKILSPPSPGPFLCQQRTEDQSQPRQYHLHQCQPHRLIPV